MGELINLRRVPSRDLMQYDSMRREQGKSWSDIDWDEQDLVGDTFYEDGETHIQIVNSNPSWREIFNEQRQTEGSCSDIWILCEEGVIQAHKVFLQGKSQFLDALIAEGSENATRESPVAVTLSGVTLTVLKIFVTMLYTGQVMANKDETEAIKDLMTALGINDSSRVSCNPHNPATGSRKFKYVRCLRYANDNNRNSKNGENQSQASNPCVPTPVNASMSGTAPGPGSSASNNTSASSPTASNTPRDKQSNPSGSSSSGRLNFEDVPLPQVAKVPPGSLIEKKKGHRIQRNLQVTEPGNEHVRNENISTTAVPTAPIPIADNNQNQHQPQTNPEPNLLPPVVIKVNPSSCIAFNKQPRVVRPQIPNPQPSRRSTRICERRGSDDSTVSVALPKSRYEFDDDYVPSPEAFTREEEDMDQDDLAIPEDEEALYDTDDEYPRRPRTRHTVNEALTTDERSRRTRRSVSSRSRGESAPSTNRTGEGRDVANTVENARPGPTMRRRTRQRSKAEKDNTAEGSPTGNGLAPLDNGNRCAYCNESYLYLADLMTHLETKCAKTLTGLYNLIKKFCGTCKTFFTNYDANEFMEHVKICVYSARPSLRSGGQARRSSSSGPPEEASSNSKSSPKKRPKPSETSSPEPSTSKRTRTSSSKSEKVSSPSKIKTSINTDDSVQGDSVLKVVEVGVYLERLLDGDITRIIDRYHRQQNCLFRRPAPPKYSIYVVETSKDEQKLDSLRLARQLSEEQTRGNAPAPQNAEDPDSLQEIPIPPSLAGRKKAAGKAPKRKGGRKRPCPSSVKKRRAASAAAQTKSFENKPPEVVKIPELASTESRTESESTDVVSVADSSPTNSNASTVNLASEATNENTNNNDKNVTVIDNNGSNNNNGDVCDNGPSMRVITTAEKLRHTLHTKLLPQYRAHAAAKQQEEASRSSESETAVVVYNPSSGSASSAIAEKPGNNTIEIDLIDDNQNESRQSEQGPSTLSITRPAAEKKFTPNSVSVKNEAEEEARRRSNRVSKKRTTQTNRMMHKSIPATQNSETEISNRRSSVPPQNSASASSNSQSSQAAATDKSVPTTENISNEESTPQIITTITPSTALEASLTPVTVPAILGLKSPPTKPNQANTTTEASSKQAAPTTTACQNQHQVQQATSQISSAVTNQESTNNQQQSTGSGGSASVNNDRAAEPHSDIAGALIITSISNETDSPSNVQQAAVIIRRTESVALDSQEAASISTPHSSAIVSICMPPTATAAPVQTVNSAGGSNNIIPSNMSVNEGGHNAYSFPQSFIYPAATLAIAQGRQLQQQQPATFHSTIVQPSMPAPQFLRARPPRLQPATAISSRHHGYTRFINMDVNSPDRDMPTLCPQTSSNQTPVSTAVLLNQQQSQQFYHTTQQTVNSSAVAPQTATVQPQQTINSATVAPQAAVVQPQQTQHVQYIQQQLYVQQIQQVQHVPFNQNQGISNTPTFVISTPDEFRRAAASTFSQSQLPQNPNSNVGGEQAGMNLQQTGQVFDGGSTSSSPAVGFNTLANQSTTSVVSVNLPSNPIMSTSSAGPTGGFSVASSSMSQGEGDAQATNQGSGGSATSRPTLRFLQPRTSAAGGVTAFQYREPTPAPGSGNRPRWTNQVGNTVGGLPYRSFGMQNNALGETSLAAPEPSMFGYNNFINNPRSGYQNPPSARTTVKCTGCGLVFSSDHSLQQHLQKGLCDAGPD